MYKSPSHSEVSESMLELLSRNEFAADHLKSFLIDTNGMPCDSLAVNFQLNDLVRTSCSIEHAFLCLTMSIF